MFGNGKGGRGKGSQPGTKGAGRGTDFGGGRGRGRGDRGNQPVNASGTTQSLQEKTATADTGAAVAAAKGKVSRAEDAIQGVETMETVVLARKM